MAWLSFPCHFEELHLDDNHIMTVASATFMYINNLETLTLARNKLRGLSPRMFFLLGRLKTLDLSGNPIRELDPEVLKDVPNLKTLRCANCGLLMIKSLVYRVVPQLETLDLSDNHILALAPEEYVDLNNLKHLYLDGNRILELKDYTFQGLALQHLGLSRNRMEKISKMAFEDCSVLNLDLSSNKLQFGAFRHLNPVIAHMHGLSVAGIHLSAEHIREILKRAGRLKSLNLSRMRLTQLVPTMFTSQGKLEILNLSSNSLRYIPVDILHSLPSLHTLDIRRNEFRGMPEIILRRFDRIHTIELDGNPWSCDQCHIPYLKIWLNNTKSFREACQPDVDAPKCLKCQSPMEMYDKPIIEIEGLELQPCPEGTFDNDSRHHFYENPALHSNHTDITLDEDLDHLPEKDLPQRESGHHQQNSMSAHGGHDAHGESDKSGEKSSGGKKKTPQENNVAVIDELIRKKNAKAASNGRS
ncbi:Insulin-like growth factor-binding protein complex acid labile chain [Penaeus vannamei]|uniref:Insulin-like growth factor-binding protein complex acid labile chain n=1 Tax=Penaeus vannamei TaxID=6689 RepID=A0A3R7NQK0_PENVA|nr:Insulin-like growth factor-binding protein complex acid labile chain [Penaeus vannamei]